MQLQYCAFLPCDGTNTNSSSSSDSNNNMLNFWAPSVRNSTSAPSNATISGVHYYYYYYYYYFVFDRDIYTS